MAFAADFNLNFGSRLQHEIAYTAQVIFRADGADSSSTATEKNISYFMDEYDPAIVTETTTTQQLERADEYEFTFLMYKDGAEYKIHDVRHNGLSVGNNEEEWQAAMTKVVVPSTEGAPFRINAAYGNSYHFGNWKQIQPEPIDNPGGNVTSIFSYVRTHQPVEGNDTLTPIIFAAVLTKNS